MAKALGLVQQVISIWYIMYILEYIIKHSCLHNTQSHRLSNALLKQMIRTLKPIWFSSFRIKFIPTSVLTTHPTQISGAFAKRNNRFPHDDATRWNSAWRWQPFTWSFYVSFQLSWLTRRAERPHSIDMGRKWCVQKVACLCAVVTNPAGFRYGSRIRRRSCCTRGPATAPNSGLLPCFAFQTRSAWSLVANIAAQTALIFIILFYLHCPSVSCSTVHLWLLQKRLALCHGFSGCCAPRTVALLQDSRFVSEGSQRHTPKNRLKWPWCRSK